MKLVLDMVHHNPGEAQFETAFLDPRRLAAYGYNGQVFKHINCAASFDAFDGRVFPIGSPERAWIDRLAEQLQRQNLKAKKAGLQVYYHIDLFVLPKNLIALCRDDICDPETGRISLDRPKTLEVHHILFEEICGRFPEVDGFIVRVGETYLFDTPHHVGNSPIPIVGEPWTPIYRYRTILKGEPTPPAWTSAQVEAYVKLLRFLREELCVRHGKRLIFRTWDIFPDKLHAVSDHYLEVTDQVEPHPLLLFSIKHTALDFWRRVKVNECLTRGCHQQVIEVQCAREYEGKGAYPDYVMEGLFNGFEENTSPIGLRDLLRHPLIQGVYGWSRGGGWYGPYVKNELWCDLHGYVLGQVASGAAGDEESAFNDYCINRIGLSSEDVRRFRELCLLSSTAVLKGRYCEAFDAVLKESVLPSGLWMRDDRLGGQQQLALVFEYLIDHQLLDQALAEKAESVEIWKCICQLAGRISSGSPRFLDHLRVSADYGRLLFSIVEAGWRLLAADALNDDAGEILERYDALWDKYRRLATSPQCASLYHGTYFCLPAADPVPGLDDSVHRIRLRLAAREKIAAV
jgi:hypothetical protein